MTIKTRPQLKSYFVKNAIPTGGNFADLIDTPLNQAEDGVFKVAGEPLSVVAAPGAPRRVLRFYSSVPAANPDWLIGLNPAQDPGNPATARLGFGVTDANGIPRLFIDAATGNVGIGTNNPGADKLQVLGSASFSGAVVTSGRVDATAGLTVSSNLIANGNLGVGTINPQARLHVEGTTRLNGGVTIASGGANIGGGLSVAGPVAFASGASVTFDSAVNTRLGLTVTGGTLAAQAVTATTIAATGSVTASGGITVPAAQAINFDSVLNARLGLSVTGGPTTVGLPQANQNLTVNGNLATTGTFAINGNITTTSNIGIGVGNPDVRLQVEGAARVAGLLTATGGIVVPGGQTLNFDSILNARFGLNVTGGLLTVGTAQANQNLVVNGNLSANGAAATLTVASTALTVSAAGNTGLGVADTAGNRLRVAGSARVDGILTAGDTITASAGINLPVLGKGLATTGRGVLLKRANNQCITLPTFPDTIPFDTGVTIQAWIFNNSTDVITGLVDLGTGGPGSNIVVQYMPDGGLWASVYQQAASAEFIRTLAGAVPRGVWTHVTLTIEPFEAKGIARFYLNGVNTPVFPLANQQMISNGASILMPQKVTRTSNFIGRNNWGSTHWDGSIAEVSIWSGVRAPVLDPLVGNEAGLVAYYKLGDNALDSKLNPLAASATLTGSPLPTFGVSAEADDWRAAAPASPWENFGAPHDAIGYYKDTSGVVHLRGVLRTTPYNPGAAITGKLFNLPAGFRPQYQELLFTISDGKIGRIDVMPAGDVYVYLGTTAWVNLNGLTFRAHH